VKWSASCSLETFSRVKEQCPWARRNNSRAVGRGQQNRGCFDPQCLHRRVHALSTVCAQIPMTCGRSAATALPHQTGSRGPKSTPNRVSEVRQGLTGGACRRGRTLIRPKVPACAEPGLRAHQERLKYRRGGIGIRQHEAPKSTSFAVTIQAITELIPK